MQFKYRATGFRTRIAWRAPRLPTHGLTHLRQSKARCATVSAMSRAFVKETDGGPEELPDRPISSHRNFVTESGLAAIESSIVRCEAAHRAATDKGDPQAAAAAFREVRYWRARRASAEVVRTPSNARTASFGMTVALRRQDGREQTFRIVGEDEADPSRGTVSYLSPLARAVLTYSPGETVEIGGATAVILDVR